MTDKPTQPPVTLADAVDSLIANLPDKELPNIVVLVQRMIDNHLLTSDPPSK